MTGAAGFIGSHLVEELVGRGHRVRAMVHYNSASSHGWLTTLPPEVMGAVEVVAGDVRDASTLRDLATGADVIYHLAALIAIPYSYRAPRSYAETNVLGTLNVMEVARELGTQRIVHTSTSEVYGTARTVPIDESHPLQAQSPYSATKIGADKIAESYQRSFGLPVTTLRPFNTYGPRQSARAVIPTVISQLLSDSDVVRLGDLRPTRDFLFVRDTARAFVALGEAEGDGVVGRVFNAGTGREVSIADVTALLSDLTGRKKELVEEGARLRPSESEVMRLVCDSTQLRTTTGWRPECDLKDGLEATVAWFSEPANLERYRSDRYTV